MSHNQVFRFKKFAIVQERSAMKVGTDGIILGAWSNPGDSLKILDIGTGTGLIALMMAQKTKAKITAVEIDKDAFEEACFNFKQSPWSDRLIPIHSSFQKFCSETNNKFDLIISNPPFFENALRASEINRSNARHSDCLPFNDLIKKSIPLLTDEGKMNIIVDAREKAKIIKIAETNNLFINRHTMLKPNPQRPHHRSLIEFSKNKKPLISNELIIEKEIHHQYTSDFIDLTKDFYLNF